MHGTLPDEVLKSQFLLHLPNEFSLKFVFEYFFKNGHDILNAWEVRSRSWVNLRNLAVIQMRKPRARERSLETNEAKGIRSIQPAGESSDCQRSEQSSRSRSVVDISFSRTKQTSYARKASHARVHVFTPRRCFTQDCSEQSCRLSTPVSISVLIRFSKRSKNASSYPVPA